MDRRAQSCEIQDTGAGLGVADWTVALAPFYSTKGPFARDPTQAGIEATGLGLTVSQHLVALHGGHLELRSLPGEGTIAKILLPRGDALPTGEHAPGHEQKAAAATEQRITHCP